MSFLKRFSLAVIGVLLLSGLVYGVGAGATKAVEIRTRDTEILEEEYIDDDVFVFGDEITVNGTVTGDLVASGERVTISGTVDGNVYVSGGEVVVSGDVGKSLFAAGGRVKILGMVERSVYAAGGMVLVTSDADINEDLLVGCGQLDIGGVVGGDVWVSGGNIDMNAEVGGDFLASGGVVSADENNVAGDYRVNTNNKGFSWSKDTGSEEVETAVKKSAAVGVFLRIMWFVGTILVGAILIWLVPVKTGDIVDNIAKDTGEFMISLLVGLLVSAAAPIAILLLLATVIGAPVAFLVTGLLIFLLILGSLWFDMAIGNRILGAFGYTDNRLLASLLVGKAVRALIVLIPCVGALYSLVTGWVVVGAVVRMKYERFQVSRGSTKSMKDSLIPKQTKAKKSDK